VLIEHEQGNDIAALVTGGARRLGQRRVIRDAQILAAEPDEGTQGY